MTKIEDFSYTPNFSLCSYFNSFGANYLQMIFMRSLIQRFNTFPSFLNFPSKI